MFVILFSRSFFLGRYSKSVKGIINSPLYVDLKQRGHFCNMFIRSVFEVGIQVEFARGSCHFIDLFCSPCRADHLLSRWWIIACTISQLGSRRLNFARNVKKAWLVRLIEPVLERLCRIRAERVGSLKSVDQARRVRKRNQPSICK